MAELCGARVGPVWKLDGEVCTCVLPVAGHPEPVGRDGVVWTDHECDCGTWWCDESPVDRGEAS